MAKSSKIKYYAYITEDNKGITLDWGTCKDIVAGGKSKYKSFVNIQEATLWLNSNGTYKEEITLQEGIYFDAGTGRGLGVEVRITDKYRKSYISDILKSNKKFLEFLNKNGCSINEFDNVLLSKDKTNNYGELFGLWLAMEIARITGISSIFGDSKLVIDYWSKGIYNTKGLAKQTIDLIKKVSENREKYNFDIKLISGNINPADLGFHK